MGKLSVLKGSAERSERFFSGLPLMYDVEIKKFNEVDLTVSE